MGGWGDAEMFGEVPGEFVDSAVADSGRDFGHGKFAELDQALCVAHADLFDPAHGGDAQSRTAGAANGGGASAGHADHLGEVDGL